MAFNHEAGEYVKQKYFIREFPEGLFDSTCKVCQADKVQYKEKRQVNQHII